MVTWGKNKYMLKKKNKHTCSPLKTKGFSNQACSAIEYSEINIIPKKRKPSTSSQSIHMTTLPGWAPSTAPVRLKTSWAHRKGAPYKHRCPATKILDPQTIFVFYSSRWGQSSWITHPKRDSAARKAPQVREQSSQCCFWRIPWTDEPGHRSPQGCKELDMTEAT